jgi:uncharacterized protein YbcI
VPVTQPTDDGVAAGLTQQDHRLAIANAITRLHRQHYGRGAAYARTVMDRDYVVVFLHDIYTTVERTLIDAGHFDAVRATRTTFQQTMRESFSKAVEEVTGRRVVAFMSENHQSPDISAEIFVLEPESAS